MPMARREAALTSLTDSGLDLTLTTDSSFIREIVHHLADSDDIWKICIKAALGNNDSSFSLQCYWDKPKLDWSNSWKYASRSIGPSLDLLHANRQYILELIQSIPDAWEKSIRLKWPDGREECVTVGDVLEMQARHVIDHIKDIQAIRQVHHLGKTVQEVTPRRELSSLREAININALEDWEASVAGFLADRKAGVDELKTVTPQILEEQHAVFLLKKQVVDTLVERVEIDQERNLHVQIRLNLLDILGKDTENRTTAGVQNSEVETYTRRQSTTLDAFFITLTATSDGTAMPLLNAWTGFPHIPLGRRSCSPASRFACGDKNAPME